MLWTWNENEWQNRERENRRQLGNAALWQSWSKWNRPTTRPQIVLERSSPLTAGPNVGSRYNLFTPDPLICIIIPDFRSVATVTWLLKCPSGAWMVTWLVPRQVPPGGLVCWFLIKKWFFFEGTKVSARGTRGLDRQRHDTATVAGLLLKHKCRLFVGLHNFTFPFLVKCCSVWTNVNKALMLANCWLCKFHFFIGFAE